MTLEATTLFSDNQSAIALTKDHQYHTRTKHISIRFYFISWIVENGSLHLIYCPTNDMVADSLTKALPSPQSQTFHSQTWACIGLRGSVGITNTSQAHYIHITSRCCCMFSFVLSASILLHLVLLPKHLH